MKVTTRIIDILLKGSTFDVVECIKCGGGLCGMVGVRVCVCVWVRKCYEWLHRVNGLLFVHTRSIKIRFLLFSG